MKTVNLSPLPIAYGNTTTVHALAFSPDGEALVASVGPRRLWHVRVRDGLTRLLLIPPSEGDAVYIDCGIKNLAWAADGSRLAALTRRLEVAVWTAEAMRAGAEIPCAYVISIPEEAVYFRAFE